jgi:hypothetical protein
MVSRPKPATETQHKKLVRLLRKLIKDHGEENFDRAFLEAKDPPRHQTQGAPKRWSDSRDAWVLYQVQAHAQEHSITEAAAIERIAPLLVPPSRLLGTGGLGDLVAPAKPGRYPMTIVREITATIDERATLIGVEAIRHAVKRAKRRRKAQGN